MQKTNNPARIELISPHLNHSHIFTACEIWLVVFHCLKKDYGKCTIMSWIVSGMKHVNWVIELWLKEEYYLIHVSLNCRMGVQYRRLSHSHWSGHYSFFQFNHLLCLLCHCSPGRDESNHNVWCCMEHHRQASLMNMTSILMSCYWLLKFELFTSIWS